MPADTETPEDPGPAFEEHSENAENAAAALEPDDAEQFGADYVRKLRAEAAKHRTAAKDAEAELAELRAERDRRTIAEIAGDRLTDADDLGRFVQLDDLRGENGRYDEGKVAAAVAELLARKPHLGAPRVGLGQGRRPLVPSERSAGEVLDDALHGR